MITIITVVNNPDIFTRTVGNNPFMNVHRIHQYDNTNQNLGIPKRYNDCIDRDLPEDSWMIFCHQDFAFEEDLVPRLKDLPRDSIYGPTGTGPVKQLLFIASLSRYGIERFRVGFFYRWKKFGRITQRTPDRARRMGRYIRKPVTVDTLDSCCLIVHSSLIRKYRLRFDEHLEWHLYAEDFSLNARKMHTVLTKAMQFKCSHYSAGTMNSAFYENLNYLRTKYGTDRFATTCHDGYARF
jgi:hypothetical protein